MLTYAWFALTTTFTWLEKPREHNLCLNSLFPTDQLVFVDKTGLVCDFQYITGEY